MIISKTRRWGNSLVALIPKDEVVKLKLCENQDIAMDISPAKNILVELFGFGTGKVNRNTGQILKEARLNTSKFFK